MFRNFSDEEIQSIRLILLAGVSLRPFANNKERETFERFLIYLNNQEEIYKNLHPSSSIEYESVESLFENSENEDSEYLSFEDFF